MKRWMAAMLFVCAPLPVTGCYAYVEPEVVYAEPVDVPPHVDIHVYPQAYYAGHVVFLYQDRWYYRDGPRWVYFRREPPELLRQRRFVSQAPPAAAPVPRQAPPARLAPAYPPPAYREPSHAPPARPEPERAPPAHREPTYAPRARPGPAPAQKRRNDPPPKRKAAPPAHGR